MPTYPYECPACQFEFEVVKPVADIDQQETCLKCGAVSNRYIGRTHFYGASDWKGAEFDPSLGCVVRSNKHRRELAKRRGMVEIGNEKPETIHREMESSRAHREEMSWRQVDKEA